MNITIGTRGSALALKQIDLVKEVLLRANPTLEIQTKIIKTEGDVNTAPIPLDTVGKGWFTKEIETALLAGEIDLAVHSLKDVADVPTHDLCIDAYLSREDARDVLITKNGESLASLRVGAVIGTDSARRQVQIQALRPDVEVRSIRGNVPTRIEKLHAEDYDAIILAAAGLKRLGLDTHVTHYFEPTEMTPSPGQGTLAIQVHEGNTILRELLKKINDPSVSQIAIIERSFSRAIGGGCKAPVGAYAWRDNETITLMGMIVTKDGSIIRKELSAPHEESDLLGETLAHTLITEQ